MKKNKLLFLIVIIILILVLLLIGINIQTKDQTIEDVLKIDLNPKGDIPEGAYYVNGSTDALYEGTMPNQSMQGDVYIYQDYMYIYVETDRYKGWQVFLALDLYGVKDYVPTYTFTDMDKTEYGQILESINGEPIIIMNNTFLGCSSMLQSPKIPNSVLYMYNTYSGCTSLEEAPVIPNGVRQVYGIFSGCTSLKEAPVIPSSVKEMDRLFSGCTSLNGNVEINSNPETFDDCFAGTTKPIKIIGSTIMKEVLAQTSSNNNVKF